MAIALDRAASVTNTTAAAGLPMSWPGGAPADGRLMVAVIAAILQTTITAPTGWTLLGSQDAGSNLRTWAYYRWAASESATVTWTLGASSKSWAWAGSYSGVHTGSVPVTASSSSATAAASYTGSGVTVQPGGWRVDAIASRRATNGTATTWALSDGVATSRLNFGSTSGSSDISGGLFDSGRALSAETAARTFTATNVEAIAALWAISLSPVAVGAVTYRAGRWGSGL